MADISTLTGITEVDHKLYEVTSVVNIAGGIDDIEDATFIMKDGGLLRWRDPCTTTFTRCTFIETLTAQALGADNFNTYTLGGVDGDSFSQNNARARWHIQNGGICAPVFKGCEWRLATDARSDFDVQYRNLVERASPTFEKDEYGNYCKVTIEANPNRSAPFAQFNHFASDLIKVDGLIIDHKVGAQGAFEFARIPDDVDQMKDIIIVDNNENDVGRHVVLLGYNVPDGGSKTIKGLGCRNIALFGGGFDYTLRLVDPVGLVRKASDVVESNDGRIQGFRTFSGNLIDFNSQDVTGRILFIDSTNNAFYDLVGSSSFSAELQSYEETYDSNVLDTSMQNYTSVYAAYGFISQSSSVVAEETITDPNFYNAGNILLFNDSAVTIPESTIEVATDVGTANELYSGLQYWSTYRQDHTESVGKLPVSANGSVLDFGSYDVVVDPTLDLPFPTVWQPIGQTHPVGVTGTYITGLTIDNAASPIVEKAIPLTDLNSQTAWSTSSWRLGDQKFNNDGTKFYVHAYPTDSDSAQTIMQWSLSTPYDVSTSTYDGSKTNQNVNGQAGTFSFSADGTRLTLAKRWGSWYYATLTTAWDVTTASLWTSLTWDSGRAGHTWNNDGTQLIAIEDSRGNWRGALKTYTASTPYDITSIQRWEGVSIQFGTNTNGWITSAVNDKWLNTVNFAADGQNLLLHNGASGNLYVFELATPYVVPTDLDINNAVDVIKLGGPLTETVASIVYGDKVYFSEIRDLGYDDDQTLNVLSLPARQPRSYAGSDNTVYVKSTNLNGSGGFDTIQTSGFITLSNGAGSDMKLIDANGVQTSVTIAGINPNTEVRMYRSVDDTEVVGVESSTGTQASLNYRFTTPEDYYIVIHNEQYTTSPRLIDFTTQSNTAVLTVFQQIDRAYINP